MHYPTQEDGDCCRYQEGFTFTDTASVFRPLINTITMAKRVRQSLERIQLLSTMPVRNKKRVQKAPQYILFKYKIIQELVCHLLDTNRLFFLRESDTIP